MKSSPALSRKRFEKLGCHPGPALLSLWLGLLLSAGCQTVSKEKELASFVNTHVAKIEALSARANLAYWEAATTGKTEKFAESAQLRLQIRQIYAEPNDFARVKAFKKSPIGDSRLARQVDMLYYSYLQNQIEPDLLKQIVELDTKVQEAYNNYRPTMDGRKVTMSDIYTTLTTETDCGKRETVWRASRQIGNVIVGDFLNLVRLRNQAARRLGFDDFHTMTVIIGEQRVEELDEIFDELDRLTRKPFVVMKSELDGILAKSYSITPEELMPWHYHDPFFQRTPLVYELDLDRYYKGQDVKELARRYYASVGLPIDDILARSDLYYRDGKYPHAFSHDVDRSGDVRVLANLQDTERWMETLLHELGHAIYDKHHDLNEPWLLREPAHALTTEAIAMFFGRLSRNAAWMQQMLNLSDKETARIKQVSERYLRFQQVLFVRWALVMYHFEKALYADPDQDLNGLWWDLVEKYQLVKRPPGPADAGWLSKLHFTTAPCYYHNYMLGELLASQLHDYIVRRVLRLESTEGLSYVGDQRVGRYVRMNVFGPGARYLWNELIVRATGRPLSPKCFVEQFVSP
jgi:peptidyl-dipeptidase A